MPENLELTTIQRPLTKLEALKDSATIRARDLYRSAFVSPGPQPALTGPYDSEALTQISPHPITVTVERVAHPKHERDLARALGELCSHLEAREDTLGAVLFAPGTPGDPWQLVVRFTDVLAVREWETSPERARALATIEPWVKRSSVATAPSPDAFFHALDATSSTHPARRVIHDSMWAIPTSLVMTFLVYPLLMVVPVIPRILAAVLVGTILSVFATAPARSKLRRWISHHRPLR